MMAPIRVTFVALFALGVIASARGSAIQENHDSTTIRVLLKCCAKGVSLRTFSGQLTAFIDTNPLPLDLGQVVTIRWVSKDRLELNGSDLRLNQVRLSHSISNALIQLNAQAYRGDIVLRPRPLGLEIVNQLHLGDYLVGTLAGEMSSDWEIEVLKAQAVASRSFALDRVLHPRAESYDIEATTQDQMFVGAGIESPNILRAIRETRGVFLTYNTIPLKAYFHSRCGGGTDAASTVWSKKSGQNGLSISCPFCQRNPLPWQAVIDRTELARAFGVPQFMKEFALLARRSEVGRVLDLTLTNDSQSRTLSADLLRSRLGYTRFKSGVFDWHHKGQNLVFVGKGYGHGVGMCQWGARHLARLGKSYREILVYYYPTAAIK